MATAVPTTFPADWTLADMVSHLGDIPLQRIHMHPPPGLATEADALALQTRSQRTCELIDGVLVEKTVGYYESLLAMEIVFFLKLYLRDHDLGIVLGPDGMLKILPGQIRAPDISFLRWERFADRRLPAEPIPAVVPDLAIEVLSEGNTEHEMQRKLRDYFTAGVQLVWCIDARSRLARAYTSEDRWREVGLEQSLEGGDVLPGFTMSLAEVFSRAGNRT